MIRDLLKAFALSNALPIAGILLALCVTGWGAYRISVAHARSAGYSQGYQTGSQVVRDSAKIATQREKEARADSLAKATRDQSSALVAESRHFDTVARHTPRIEAIPLPAGIDTSMVGVTVESTGEHFILPRGAARYWFTADSLVGVAQQLLAKYAAANKQWAEAWQSEHEARIGADSLVSMYAERLRNVTPQVQAKPSWKRKAATAAALLTLGAVLHNNIRIR